MTDKNSRGPNSFEQKPKHSPEYRRRRFFNWFPLGITYAAFYMGRYNLNVASSTIMTTFHFSKAEFGTIATAGFWTYALSVLFSGPLADRVGGKKAILFGAAGAATLNLIIGLLFLSGWQTKVLVGMALLYAVNQFFQSFGALSVVKVNTPWFHVRERGVFGGVFGMMISGGYFLALTVGGWILAYLPWYYVFLIPSAVIATMFVIDYLVVRDTPKQAGFQDFNTGDATAHDKDKDKPVDYRWLMKRVFKNPVVLTLAAAEFCTGFVRQGLMLWFVPFLKEVHHVQPGSFLFSLATGGITVGGILGGLLCGYMSDAWFQSRRAPVAFIFYLAQIACLLAIGMTRSAAAAAFLVPFTCAWIFGVHGMLSGTASADFGGAKAAATVTGILDGVQYLAAGLTGVLLGSMLDKYGWSVWTYAIIPFSVIGAVLMIRIWNETPAKDRARREAVAAAEALVEAAL